MPTLRNLVALAAVPLAEAHFSFVRIAHNDVWAEPLQYIRNKTTPFEEISTPYTRLFNYPTYNIDSPESIRCGRDSFKSAAITETLTIKAGDKLEIAATTLEPGDWKSSHFDNCPDNRGICTVEENALSANIIHDGPLIVHLSAVPDDSSLEEYDGSGEWVKIFSMGVELRDNGALHWLPRNLGPNYEAPMPPHLIFHVPKETPAGDYLMRLDFIYPGLKGADNSPQLYPACVHLRVESDAKGHLPEGVLIPEIFSGSAKGLLVSIDMYNGKKLDPDFVYAGGPIWDGSELKEDAP